jgi:hypothetical protein
VIGSREEADFAGYQTNTKSLRRSLGLIESTRFNIEVQLQGKGDMNKRSVYYGGREPVDSLNKREISEDLPDIIPVNYTRW